MRSSRNGKQQFPYLFRNLPIPERPKNRSTTIGAILGFRRFSDYRNRNNGLTSCQEFSRCFAAGDFADHYRSQYGTADLDVNLSLKIRIRKLRVPIDAKESKCD